MLLPQYPMNKMDANIAVSSGSLKCTEKGLCAYSFLGGAACGHDPEKFSLVVT
jgi:hypothetical protein